MNLINFETKDNNGTLYGVQLCIWDVGDMSFRIWETNNEKDTARIRFVDGKEIDWEYDGTQDWYYTPSEIREFANGILVGILRNQAFL